jgi:hypothetical protein
MPRIASSALATSTAAERVPLAVVNDRVEITPAAVPRRIVAPAAVLRSPRLLLGPPR